MIYVWFLLGVVLAYLVGSIPTSVWIGKIFYRKDIRDYGSGNAGATNTFRVLGIYAGIFVLLFDAFKGWIVIYSSGFFAGQLSGDETINLLKVCMAFFAVFGHIFPLYAGFRGGKGVATLIGVLAALFPQVLLILLGVFIVSLLISRYVSLSSLVAAFSFPICIIVIFNYQSPVFIIFSIVVAILVILTHQKNIIRLLKGTESRIYFVKKK